jgi:hypothetical protein
MTRGKQVLRKQKIATASETVHPYVQSYRDLYYGGRAWANELAKRGYGVLVHDIFPFESRKIIASELPGLVVERMMLPPEELKELTPDDLQSGSICTEFDVSEAETVRKSIVTTPLQGSMNRR